jgi:DNA-binding transcriptional regulator YdaS (Cro superfamily)
MPKTTVESRRVKDAISASELSKAAIADVLGVSPSLVSQWASGHRPVPADKAAPLAKLIALSPQEVSAAYRQVQQSQEGNMLARRAHSESEPMSSDEAIRRLDRELHAVHLAIGALASVMVVHRPAEAAEAASALRRRVPAKLRESGLVHELIELLDKSGKRA